MPDHAMLELVARAAWAVGNPQTPWEELPEAKADLARAKIRAALQAYEQERQRRIVETVKTAFEPEVKLQEVPHDSSANRDPRPKLANGIGRRRL